MFSNIRSIYDLHHKNLLPKLQDRMKKWKEQKEKFSPKGKVDHEWPGQKIGDIFVEYAPLLKMYSDYIENFDNAMNTIDKQRKKNKKFAAIMEEIQATPELHRLSLQHHMLSPVQRIPRYKLLLEDYIKRLPENSSDLENAKKALELVEQAATHSNDTMKRIEQLKKIMEVQELLGVQNLSSPRREFVKEGKISKLSATRGGDSLKESLKDMDRYLFLFNDLLLLCSWNSITKRVRGFSKFKLKTKFEFDSLVVTENVVGDEENERSFSISHSSSPKSMKTDLLARTAAEKEEWIQAIAKALKAFNDRKAELKASGIQDQESCDSKNSISIEDSKSNPLLLLNDNDYDNDSDAPSFDTHDDEFGEHEDCDEDHSDNDTPESGVTLRSSKRSPKSRYSVKSLSLGRNKSPTPSPRMKKKNSVLF